VKSYRKLSEKGPFESVSGLKNVKFYEKQILTDNLELILQKSIGDIF